MNYIAAMTGEVLLNLQQEAGNYQVENSGLDNMFMFKTIGGFALLCVTYAIVDRKVKQIKLERNNQTQPNSPESEIN